MTAIDLFRYNLKRLIESRFETAAAFCRASGIGHSLVSNWLSGNRFPRPEQMDRVAKACKVPVDRLLLSPNEKREGSVTVQQALVVLERHLRETGVVK